jgi:hypothetical protein
VTRRGEASVCSEHALAELVGEKLSAVTFVMEYVQLAFDGPTLNAYTWPTIQLRDRVVRRDDPAYRDELCGRIAATVAGARVRKDAIELAFADGSMIGISLRAEDLEGGPEAADFKGRELLVFYPT